ncbi:hypothetical protein GCM10022207_78220 [Streptomyces lannensis]|uniref:Uncharacterized protein n=1 Tax=Streptomyces lannensis TaxID=766498 RepID=A0ABP7LCQ1_9ACTN
MLDLVGTGTGAAAAAADCMVADRVVAATREIAASTADLPRVVGANSGSSKRGRGQSLCCSGPYGGEARAQERDALGERN